MSFSDRSLKAIGDHPLAVAQLLQLRRQLPWVYGVLVLSSLQLAYTHFGIAPHFLTIIVPAVLISAALWRLAAWLRPLSAAAMTEAGASRVLKRASILGSAVALTFGSWAMALGDYGDAYLQSHVAVFIGVTLLGCMFCLIHLPRAASLGSISVLVPALGFRWWADNPVLMAIALNVALVAAVVVKVLRDSQHLFTDLVRSRDALHVERQQAERLNNENQQLAYTDPLTGLRNRRWFFGKLEELLAARAEAQGPPFCVAVLDLDRFKPINDTYGHVCGDSLLRAIGCRLASTVDDQLLIARLGGDEFGVLFDGPRDAAERAITALCEDIHAPVLLGEVTARVGCSAGIAVFPDAGATAHQLFDRSDYALYHAKSHRRGHCAVFSHEHEAIIRHEKEIETLLLSADLATEIDVYFQPIFDTRTMTVSSVEALARWHSPVLGPVTADRLIGAAERVGSINTITMLLFEKALQRFRLLPRTISMSFNLSGKDLSSVETMQALVRQVIASGVAPQRIIFEVTETALVSDFEMARQVLERLRGLGMRTSLDDFGTGYSSLATLHELPLDMLKVDRSFAAGIGTASGRKLVTAIRNLAQSLALECTMEGIETERQLLDASLIGYRYAQGYLLGRPMTVDDLLMTIPDVLGAPVPGSSATLGRFAA
ncbi:MAG: putative bifunctional diguanylate cyclase/phosphodiesterase [Sphingomonas sp.]